MAKRNKIVLMLLVTLIIIFIPKQALALNDVLDNTDNLGIFLNNDNEDPQATVDVVKLFITLTILTLAPSFLILTTSFTRIMVVLSFLRSAMGTQQTPPNQLLIGLALFLTFFVMQPVYSQIIDDAYTPFINEEITQGEALDKAAVPMKKFMLEQTREKDLALFLRASNSENYPDPMDIPLTVIVPSFAISELKTAFSIGFMIFIPFLVIDMIVSSILMSMGMFMLPPVMISLPFKLLLFILVDGWYLTVESLLKSFQVGG